MKSSRLAPSTAPHVVAVDVVAEMQQPPSPEDDQTALVWRILITGSYFVNNNKEFVVQENVQAILSEMEAQLKLKVESRTRIHKSIQNRPEDSYFSKLDSNIKKNTAFVRKLKNFTEVQKEGILKDMNALNLTKYVSEVANGIVEAKLKMNDIPSMIQVCVTLHEKYAEFSPQLLEAWQKVLSLKRDEKVMISYSSIIVLLYLS